MNVYSLRRVSKTLAGREVLRSVDLDISAGEVTALVGPSGSGKSTVLRLLNRLTDPDAGTISYRGQDLSALDALKLRTEAVLVPQEGVMFPGSVEENVRYASRIHGREMMDPADALQAAGLSSDFLERDASKLSGGEKKRVALARALALRPQVLLMDEPTSGVDPRSSEVIERSILNLSKDGTTVVWVTHDVAQAKRVADRIASLKGGTVVSSVGEDFRWGDAY